ncbi:amino acid adenylation domain-containing protein [Streptomyces sp. STR69]|uniref:amino acid adenylation domain-containing protein n=1 Tax=Streptomyces sp. STR69 TaxID=1796942 RepID=UPI0021C6CACF|nr:amino acid adenylation domain-containing protein [Streptomyces sp. STR69]
MSTSTLMELLDRQCARTPDAVAVVSDDETLTYGQLARRSDAVAARLRALGAGPDRVVALALERSAALAVAVVGVIKAGAAYLPLAPEDPAERLRLLVEDSAAVAVLTTAGSGVDARPWRVPVLDPGEVLDGIVPAGAGEPAAPTGGDLAYLIYTSGSTGLPKGVLTEHAAIVNRLEWMQRALPIGPGDTVLQKTPYTFDVSVWELFWPLITGVRLVFARPGGHRDPRYLLETVHRHRVTVTHFVPSMLEEFLKELPDPRAASLRRVLVSGEELKPRVRDRFFGVLPTAELHNLYGPTEAAIDVTHWQCAPGDDPDRVPIGRAIDRARLYVLDPDLRPVAQGEPGELCIGGPVIARGYLNRPEEQRTRFVPDPYADEPGARLYRTGDLASQRADGVIDYHGRIDHQVKLGGVRIEAGEVEAALEALDDVEQAVVDLRTWPTGRPVLVGWVAGRCGAQDTAGLRERLLRTLPAAFVPGVLIPLEQLPLSRHGKVDRGKLPWPPPARETGAEPEASWPPGDQEPDGTAARVHRIWREMVPREGSNFHVAGGDSLLAGQLVAAACREFDIDLNTADFLQNPDIEALVQLVDKALTSGGRESARVLPVPRNGRLPLSSAQRRMWLLHRSDPRDVAMNIHGGLRLTGPIDQEAATRVLTGLTHRHEVLRTTFPDFDGRPVPVIADATAIEVPLREHRGLSAPERDRAARAACAEIGAAPFDLAGGPLLRARLLSFADDDHFLALGLHHIVTDGWSWSVLAHDFARLWAQDGTALPALPVQYQDYAAWEAGLAEREEDVAFWTEVLRDPPPPPRPAGSPGRPQELSIAAGVTEVQWPEGFAERLGAFCARHEVTVFTVLLAGYALLLGRLAQQEDVIVAAPVANRTGVDVEPLVGCFINTLPLRLELDEDQTFMDLLTRARAVATAAQAHGRLPIERMPLADTDRGPGRSPLLQALLVVQNTPPWHAQHLGHRVEVVEQPSPRTHYLLKLEVLSPQPPLPTRLVFATDALDAGRAATIAAQLATLLDRALADPDGYVYDFSLLDPLRR